MTAAAGRNLARLAERHLDVVGDHENLFFEGTWYSTGQQADRAGRVATGLVERGLAPGDRVVVVMANCPEVLVTYNACWRAGLVVTPLLFLISEPELRADLEDCGAVAVVTTPEFLPKVRAAVRGVASVRFVTVVGGPGEVDTEPDEPPVLPFAELEAHEPGSIVDRADEDLAALLYTGGTTGRSKGVPLTHANLYWCGEAGEITSRSSELRTGLLPLPLAHAYGLLVTCVGAHQKELNTTLLMRWFDPAKWVELAVSHRATRTQLVPSMIQMLLAQPLEQADLSALVLVNSGAAPLAEGVREQFEARVPGTRVHEGYGCTETSSLISSNPLDARRVGSVGKPVPGCEVRILDDAGTALPVGQDGEICVRSPGVTSGYWNAPEATAAAVIDGWLHTGDIGHTDADGYLYVVDRKKDLIIRGGFNVYPRDVEDVLLEHPAVAAAGVVGRPDTRLGEEVVGFVALRPDAAVSPEELIGFAKQHLAANKYPREITVLPQLPLTSVGKLDRKRLRGLVTETDAATPTTTTEAR
jgi:long-chain acyl-CoA synthetase